MQENKEAGIRMIEEIADGITAPPRELTDEEKIKDAQKIAEGIHGPEKGKLEDHKIYSVPPPPDDSHLDERHDRPAARKKTKKERAAMAAEKRKHEKKVEGAHEPRPGEGQPGKVGEPVPPGREKDGEPEPKDDWGPLI
jgi:hypothetical protein